MELNPQGLNALWQAPVGATQDAIDLQSLLSQANNVNFNQAQENYNNDVLMNPIKRAREQAFIDSTNAQLPGMRAQSSMLERKNANEDLLNEQTLADLRSKHSQDALKNYAQQIEDMGQVAQQAGSMASMGPGGVARAKQMFDQAGHGDMWMPEWDTLSPAQLAVKLNTLGREWTQTSAGYHRAIDSANIRAQAMQDVVGAKGANALALEEARQKGRAEIERYKAEQKASLSTQKDPTNLQALATKYQQLADKETDPERKQVYEDMSNAALAKLWTLNAGKAQAGQQGKPDIEKMAGIPTQDVPNPFANKQTAKPALPKVGDIVKGYKFKGGNPADKNNWEKQ